jgi:hypothetical protein
VDANTPATSALLSRARIWRQRGFAALRWLLALYLLLVLLMSLNQERFIFGGHAWQGHQWTIVNPAADSELIQLPSAIRSTLHLKSRQARSARFARMLHPVQP